MFRLALHRGTGGHTFGPAVHGVADSDEPGTNCCVTLEVADCTTVIGSQEKEPELYAGMARIKAEASQLASFAEIKFMPICTET